MATRMQQRRGTAAQWVSTNSGNGPILAAGEIGYESDTNKFKIGDGTNHWINLDYFIDSDSTVNPQFGSNIKFEGATANAFETTLAVVDPTADRTITLPDATGTVVLADGSGNVTVSGDLTVSGTTTTINSTTINATTGLVFEGSTADAFETTITVTDPTADRTITFPDTTGTVAMQSDVLLRLAKAGGLMTGPLDFGGQLATNLPTPSGSTEAATKGYVDTNFLPLTGGTLTGNLTFEGSTADAYETTLAVIDPTADRTITFPDATGTVLTTGNLSDLSFVSNIIFEGATADAFETTLQVTEPTADRTITLQDATGTLAFTADLNTIATNLNNHELDTTGIHGISDTADLVTKSGTQTLGGAKTFTGDVVLPTNTSIGTVTSTEIGYVDGVTSAIQTQLDAKAPLASPTFTGTVTLPSGTVTSAMILDGTIVVGDLADGAVTSAKILDGTIVNADINASAAIDWTKLGISSTVSSTEIGYVDGVTSAIQTQLDAKSPLASPAFTGTVTAAALTLSGNLIVNGTTTTINSTELSIDDKNIVLGDVATPSDVTADGGGITLKGATDKTFNWVDATDSWTSSENINLASGKDLKVNGTAVLSTTAGGFIFTDGTQTKEGVPSRTARFEKTASYNLSTDGLSLRDGLIEINAAGGTTLTVPANATTAFPVGTSIDILQVGAGQITVAGAVGVTVNSTPGLKLRTQWSSATLFKRGTDLWVLMGDLSA
jgi:hypothetical protein